MKQTRLEPGFLQAFRLFVVTRMVFWVVIGPILIVVQLAQDTSLTPEEITRLTIIERLTLPNLAPILAIEVLLLVLLLLPQVPRYLGRWFVPLTLMIGLVPLLVGYYWWPSENPLQSPFAIFFFVMLVLVAWQYPFRYVLAYVLGLSLYQAWLSSPLTGLPRSIDIGLLVLQAAMMLIVGYTIGRLVAIQREQRAALAEAYEKQAAANRRLKQYAATLEELTISRERNRLARELHDTLAHSLSAAIVQLEAVRSLWNCDSEDAQRMLDQADETVREGLTEARRALQALRASPLQDLGLVIALRDLAEAAAVRTGAALELRLPERIVHSMEPIVEQGMYRIAQEALENIVRHAGARSIALSVEENRDILVMSIQDDGLGLPPGDESPAEPGSLGQLGIQGMRERANLIGGQLEIHSRASQGTVVSLTVPHLSLTGGGTRQGRMVSDGSRSDL